MKIKELIRRRPITVNSDATLHDVIKLMAEQNIGFLVVVEGSDIVGVFSERDVIRSLAEEKNLDKKVKDITRTDIIKLRSDRTIEEAAQVMGKHRIRHIVVVDEKDKLAGVVSVRDILQELYSAGPATD
ncbi:MAG: CBS domain-containing protein [Candidatus Caldarchaeum sp.]|uniref:CBS domain-containing protein n=1 Tax=Caldiarchaeum subterraneum TaxID=311458 RepID=A0A7J3VT59_CALS0